MKYTIISTYPQSGSQNIGDKLITNTTIKAIKSIKGEAEIEVVWRGANWEEVKNTIMDSDAVIFACLAIRDNMGRKYYPFLEKILDSNIPFGVIAAGTSLKMNSQLSSFLQTDESTIELLNRLNKQALFFTTRGVLTQMFCDYHKLTNTSFSGDIAFFDQRFKERVFSEQRNISSIAISDPHYGKYSIKSLELLVSQLKNTFPEASISCILHGKNKLIEDFCSSKNLKIERIFKESNTGLDIYDNFDLHVGYRVHAHVSTLMRRKPSYLLEQDGRGADYGLSIEKKCTVGNFYTEEFSPSFKNIVKKIIGKAYLPYKRVNLDPVFQISAMVREDANQGFKKFLKFENQILEFNSKCIGALEKLP